jgi:hypothetical protein
MVEIEKKVVLTINGKLTIKNSIIVRQLFRDGSCSH